MQNIMLNVWFGVDYQISSRFPFTKGLNNNTTTGDKHFEFDCSLSLREVVVGAERWLCSAGSFILESIVFRHLFGGCYSCLFDCLDET